MSTRIFMQTAEGGAGHRVQAVTDRGTTGRIKGQKEDGRPPSAWTIDEKTEGRRTTASLGRPLRWDDGRWKDKTEEGRSLRLEDGSVT